MIVEAHPSQGTILVAEFWDIDYKVLNDEILLKEKLEQAIRESGCKPLKTFSHKFEPQGVSALGFLEESHIAIHTYPEHSYCSLIIYTCGTTAKPRKAFEIFADLLKAKQMVLDERIIGRKPE